MKRLTLRARLPDAAIQMAVRHPGAVLLFWLLLCIAAAPGIWALRVDTSTDSVLDRRHPAWQIYQHSQDLFGGDEIIAVALRGREPFDPAVLDEIERLSARFETLPDIRRVDSLATVPVVHVDRRGDLDLRPALQGAPAEPRARSRYVADRIRRDRIAPGSLVSEDGRVFAVNLVLERGAESRHAQLLETLHDLVDPTGGILSGVPVFRVAANERTGSEILFFAPLTALLIAAFLVVVFRSLTVVAMGAAPGVVGSWILLAAMGAFGAPLSITTMVLPSLILALGCAYAMHFLIAASGPRDRDSLERALRRVALPVALSGLTTVVGFVSIALVRIDAVRFAGGYGALGVLIVTAVTLTLLPAILTLRPLPSRPPQGFVWVRDRLAPRLIDVITRRRRAVLLAWTLLTLALAAGLGRVEVETDATRWLPPGNPVRDSYEQIRSALSGISPVNVLIEGGPGRSVLEPAPLAAIDALTSYLQSLPEVGKALSLTDPLRQLHGGFQGDPALPLPATRPLAEQYLLLLESVEPIADLVTGDRSTANILLRVDDNGSSSLMRLAEQATTWWDEHGAAGYTARPTGIMYEFARAENEIAFGQLRGLTLALAVISAILFAIFRWPRLALVSLVPNAIPLVLIFGTMGLLGWPLDAGTVMIGGLALGVAVDDTIHVATGFFGRTSAGEDVALALRETLRSVLPAILSTSLMISLAFAVLGLSEFSIIRNLGLLTAGIMILCLLADVTLLPALLLRLPSDRAVAHSVEHVRK